MTDLERLINVLKIAFSNINIYKKSDMAEYLGYKNPYFSGIINGKEKMSDAFLRNISEKLNINSQWIVTGDGEMFLDKKIIQQNKNGDNIQGHSVTVNKTETEYFIELLKKKDEQIDRLLTIIEKMQG